MDNLYTGGPSDRGILSPSTPALAVVNNNIDYCVELQKREISREIVKEGDMEIDRVLEC